MEEIYLLGVDVGTSSIKVTVIDQEARFVAQESATYRLINPQSGVDPDRHCGYVERIYRLRGGVDQQTRG